MVKILLKTYIEEILRVSVMIFSRAIKALSGPSLKIILLVLIATASGNVFAKNEITGMRVGVVQLDERPGFRLVVETKLPLKASLLLLQSPYRLVIDMPETS